MHGYAGKILRVNLSNRSISTEPTSQYAREWVGAAGIAIKILDYTPKVDSTASRRFGGPDGALLAAGAMRTLPLGAPKRLLTPVVQGK